MTCAAKFESPFFFLLSIATKMDTEFEVLIIVVRI